MVSFRSFMNLVVLRTNTFGYTMSLIKVRSTLEKNTFVSVLRESSMTLLQRSEPTLLLCFASTLQVDMLVGIQTGLQMLIKFYSLGVLTVMVIFVIMIS